jgi:hypothetical protein
LKRPPIYGLLAEFDSPTALVSAAHQAREAGYRRMDGYSPFPIEELADALGFEKTSVPLVVLIGGILGGSLGYLMQYWISAINYPLNIGGRPLNSTVAFIVVTFEMTILGAALFAVLGMLALNGLPEPYHPVFNVERFAFATRDRFFLCIEARDPRFDRAATQKFLEGLKPKQVMEVPH